MKEHIDYNQIIQEIIKKYNIEDDYYYLGPYKIEEIK